MGPIMPEQKRGVGTGKRTQDGLYCQRRKKKRLTPWNWRYLYQKYQKRTSAGTKGDGHASNQKKRPREIKKWTTYHENRKNPGNINDREMEPGSQKKNWVHYKGKKNVTGRVKRVCRG